MIAKRRILLVDDEPDFLEGLRGMLEKAGYSVRTATRGLEAWDIVQRGEVDLVLLDVNLPDLDGHSICRLIRTDLRQSALPVIMMTVLNDMANVLAGFTFGANEYLTKPFRREELLRQVERVVSRSDAA